MASATDLATSEKILKEANAAYAEVLAIRTVLLDYQMRGDLGVAFSVSRQDFVRPGPDLRKMKVKLDSLAHNYAEYFKEEFSALDQQYLLNLGCLGSVSLFADVDLLARVETTLANLLDRMCKLINVLDNAYSGVTETEAIKRANSSLTSISAERYMDLSTDLNTWAESKETDLLTEMSRRKTFVTQAKKEALNPLNAVSYSVLTAAGVAVVPLKVATTAVTFMKESLLAAAYPKTARYCNNARNTGEQAARATQISSDTEEADTFSSGAADALAARQKVAAGAPKGTSGKQTLGQKALNEDKKLQASMADFQVQLQKLQALGTTEARQKSNYYQGYFNDRARKSRVYGRRHTGLGFRTADASP